MMTIRTLLTAILRTMCLRRQADSCQDFEQQQMTAHELVNLIALIPYQKQGGVSWVDYYHIDLNGQRYAQAAHVREDHEGGYRWYVKVAGDDVLTGTEPTKTEALRAITIAVDNHVESYRAMYSKWLGTELAGKLFSKPPDAGGGTI